MNGEPVRWWQQVDWPGAIGFTLALGVSSSMVLIIVGAVVLRYAPTPQPLMTEASANLLSTMFGAAIGVLATYLGQSSERARHPLPKST